MDMMKITLQVSGREMTFSEEELVAILEKHFGAEVTKQKEKDSQKQAETEIAHTPTEGKWFEVRPAEIDQRLFSEEKSDQMQERTRQLILEAFFEMKNNSEYARPFKTLMPEKTWEEKNIEELREVAEKLGGRVADWVDQVLEWAQRIANGETWEDICNNIDTTSCYRMVIWKYNREKLIGGAYKYDGIYSPADVDYFDLDPNGTYEDVIPLVVFH